MCTFALEPLEHLSSGIKVYALHYNGKSDYQEFWAEHRSSNFTDDLFKAESRMRDAAMGLLLPKVKWRDITSGRDPIKEFEAKADSIRLYCFKTSDGYIITNVSLKTDQEKGIARLRNLKALYLASLA